MSFENANGFSDQQRRSAASAPGSADDGLGWLSTAGAPATSVSELESAPEPEDADDAVLYEEQVQPETGLFGFTLRELVIVGAWLVLFIVSFFPVGVVGGSIWTTGIGWILTIGLPTVAVFLVVLRRFSPEGIRRVGSLGIDQFASVAASVAAVAWAERLWSQIAVTIGTGLYVVGWVVIVSLLASLVLVAATVAAPLIPRLRDDFEGRMETLAHRNANPVRPVIARAPRDRAAVRAALAGAAAAAPEAAATPQITTDIRLADTTGLPASAVSSAPAPAVAPAAQTSDAGGSDVSEDTHEKDHYTDPVGVLQEIFAVEDATAQLPVVDDADESRSSDSEAYPSRRSRADSARAAQVTEPFWVLAMTERDVYDEHGQPLFRVGPTAWTLVIEDRGGAYVVRHEDGRIGYLHDITDITKG